MGTTITFRRGENDPTSGSGLTLAEPAFNTTLKTFHIGLGHGITAAWVGAPISGLSADIAAGITYKIPSAAAVKNYIGGLCYGNTGAPTITQYVSSFNGLTGAVGGVCAAQANTFTALQGFSQGIVVDSGLTASEISVTEGIIRNTVGPLEVSSTFAMQSGIVFDVYGNSTITSNNNPVANFSQDYVYAYVPVLASYGLTASTLNVTGNAVIAGNLTVSGGVTFTISENVLIEDNIITLNSNVTGSPSENAGIEIERGTSANVQLLWNESSDKWTFTNDGSTYYDLPTSVVSSITVSGGSTYTGAIDFVPNSYIAIRESGNDLEFINNGVRTFNGSTGAITFTNYVSSFNGSTGAVTGASLGANTFTGLNTFTAGLCAAGATVSGNIRFLGTASKYISTTQAPLTISGTSSGPIALGTNSVRFGVEQTDPLTITSITGVVNISTDNLGVPLQPALKFNTDDLDIIGPGSIKVEPNGYATGNRTQYLQDASGTLALTSQLMGAVNGSTAATTAVTSFNGLTGAVTGVTVGGANTFTALNTFSAGISAAGGTFSALTIFTAGLSAAGGVTFAGDIAVNGGDITTTATTATVFNSTATTLSVGGANNATVNIGNGTGVTLNIGTGSLFGGVKNINIGSNASFGTSNIAIGNSIANVTITGSQLVVESPFGSGITLSAGTVRVAGAHTISGAGTVGGLLTANAGISAAGGVTLAGTFSGTTGSFSKLLTLSNGLSAAGATFSGNVSAQSTLYTDNIQAIGTQINIANVANGRIAFGDYDGAGNSTFVFIRDATSSLLISNPYGDVSIGDPNNVDSGYALNYNAAAGYLDGGNSSLTNFSTGSFSGLLTASAGISAAGSVTFAGTVASDTGYRITSNAINAQTGTTYTFLESDNGKVVTFNNGSAVTVTIPTALPVGFNCTAIQLGAGQVGFTAASGLTMQSYGGQYRLIGQHASASIIEYSTNIVNLSGNLVV